VTYFAGNSDGIFNASDADAVNPVTWGTFPGKEYVPLFVEDLSFEEVEPLC
jgi:methylenetetrahydrofolate reductase (NADPH)